MFKTLMIAAAMLVSAPAFAQDIPSDQSILAAGKSYWQPELAPVGQMTIRINIRSQMIYVYRDEVLIGASNISSGKDGFTTPTGVFTIGGKEVLHLSKEYDAPMPYTQWFVPSRGIALHAGSTPGRTSSHGCVHLPRGFAAALFAETHAGDVVEVEDSAPDLDIRL